MRTIHSPVRQFETHAQRVVQTVLMIGNQHDRRAVGWNVFYSDDVLLAEIHS